MNGALGQVPVRFGGIRQSLSIRGGRSAVRLIAPWILASVIAGAAASAPLSPSLLKNLSVEELMNVEVTSVSRQPEKLLEAPSAIDVLTGDAIRRSGATTIPEALRLARNLQVAKKGAHEWGITARGFNTELANKLLVMIDGRTVYTPLFSGVFWDRQDYLLEDIDRIEVISGPGSTLWGSNAVNGVINITTKDSADTQGLYIEGGGGSGMRSMAGVRFGGTAGDNVHYRVYARYLDHDDSELAAGQDAHDAWQNSQAGFRMDAPIGTDSSLTFQGDIYRAKEGMRTGGQAVVDGSNVLARWNRGREDDSQVRLQVYFDRTRMDDPVPAYVINGTPLAPAGVLRDDLSTWDVDFQHSFHPAQSHHVVWGLGYRFTRDELANAPALGFLPPRLDHDLFSGFAQDEISLTDRLHATIGSKIEHTEYTGTEIEPSARLQWVPAPGRMFWSAVSRAVRTPSRIDRELRQPAPPAFVVLAGSPDFDSEVVVAYEAGFRAQFTDSLAASVSGFRNEYDRLRSAHFSPVTVFPIVFGNDLEGATQGVELAADVQLTPRWRASAGATFLHEELRVKSGGSDINNARNETGDPSRQFSLRTSVDLFSGIALDAGWRSIGKLTLNNGGKAAIVPSYSEADVRIAWKPLPELEVSLVGTNLLHARHSEYGIPGPANAQIPRSVFAKIAWRY